MKIGKFSAKMTMIFCLVMELTDRVETLEKGNVEDYNRHRGEDCHPLLCFAKFI